MNFRAFVHTSSKLLIPIFILIGLLVSNLAFGQANDCGGASVICSSGSVAYNPTGSGVDDFLDPDNDSGCLSTGEHLSAWYYFAFDASMPPNSQITFDILPDDGDYEDYDFAIYGANVDCDNLGSPIRCTYAAVGYSSFDGSDAPQDVGATGLDADFTDTTEGVSGDSYLAPLTVNPGEGFFLLVDNYAASNMGFTLNWGGSASPYLDCTATPDCNVSTIMSWD